MLNFYCIFFACDTSVVIVQCSRATSAQQRILCFSLSQYSSKWRAVARITRRFSEAERAAAIRRFPLSPRLSSFYIVHKAYPAHLSAPILFLRHRRSARGIRSADPSSNYSFTDRCSYGVDINLFSQSAYSQFTRRFILRWYLCKIFPIFLPRGGFEGFFGQ
jgi:hypothetical protein